MDLAELDATNPDVPVADSSAALELQRRLRIVRRVDVRSHGRRGRAQQLHAIVDENAVPEDGEVARRWPEGEPGRFEKSQKDFCDSHFNVTRYAVSS